jgi:DNA-binding NarL/FixJ family response regulator
VTEGTLRSHLENIYGRLQVSSRTAAVIRAFPDRVA